MPDKNDDVMRSLPADQQAQLEKTQKGRARVMALLLGAFVVLVFAISIVKIKEGMAH
jgi:hypothetical protein